VFKGSHLTTERSDSDRVYRGSFSLSTGVERKLFDFVGTNPWGKRLYWLGIYEFEGEFLKFCYVNRYGPNDTTRNRPESYVVRPEPPNNTVNSGVSEIIRKGEVLTEGEAGTQRRNSLRETTYHGRH